MQVTNKCILKLFSRIGEMNIKKRLSEWLFTLDQLKHLSIILLEDLDTIDDLSVVTYYVADEKIMGAYWLDLSILVVDNVQPKESFILKSTGMERIDDVPNSTVELLCNTFYEVLAGDKKAFIGSIGHWITFMEKQEPLLIAEERARGIYNPITNDGVFYALL